MTSRWALFHSRNGADTSSLILSSMKRGQNPASFSQTFREQGLNQGIPYGSFAMIKENHEYFQRKEGETARIQDLEQRQEAVAKGARMQALDAGIDYIFKSAKVLQKEIRREITYWQEMNTISEKGWPIQRLRQNARHAPYGVRYGVPEAGDHFKARGFAPLRMDKDGSIILDPTLTAKPKAFRVRVVVDGITSGTSQLSVGSDSTDKSIEKSIKLARASLFEEELFHELSIETRQLSAYGVRLRDGVIKIQAPQIGTGQQRHLLVDCIDRDEHTSSTQGNTDDWLAQLVAEALRLLLTHEHSMRLYRRSQLPPPLTGQAREKPTPPLLRTMLAVFHHITGVDTLYTYLRTVAQSLSSAGFDIRLETARESSWAELSSVLLTPKAGLSSTDQLLEALLKPLEGKAEMTIPTVAGSQSETLSVVTTTIMGQPLFGTEYRLSLPASLSSELGLASELTFPSVEEVTSHLDWTLSLQIAHKFIRGTFASHKAQKSHQPVVKIGLKVVKKEPTVSKLVSVDMREGCLEVKAGASLDQMNGLQSCKWTGDNGQPSLVDWIKSLAE